MKYFTVSIMLLLLISAVVEVKAQSAACNRHCAWTDPDCKRLEFDCENKLNGYKSYMGTLGAGVSLFNLPPLYVEILRKQFTQVDLANVRFGFSPGVPPEVKGMTDCNTIYFASRSFVDKVRNGTLSKDAGDDFNLLYHELTHTEQCAQKGGRDAYAVMWWQQVTTAFDRDPNAATIHQRQPMENEARARAADIDGLRLPDGLVRPVSITNVTSNVANPPVHNRIGWTAQATGGRGAIQFSFEVRHQGTPLALQDFGNNNTFQFVPTQEGSYTLRLLARQANPTRAAVTRDINFTVSGAGGADGGVRFVSTCASNSVMMGLSVRTGWYVDSIQPLCLRVSSDGSWYKVPPKTSGLVLLRDLNFEPLFFLGTGSRAGGNGGMLSDMKCTDPIERSGITALFGRSGALIDSIGVRCGTLGQVDSRVGIVSRGGSQGPLGGNGGAPFELRCPIGTVATGITGRADWVINHLALICSNPSP